MCIQAYSLVASECISYENFSLYKSRRTASSFLSNIMEDEHEVYGGDIPEDVEGDLETDLEGNPYGMDVKEEENIGDDAASKVNFCILLILYVSILYFSKVDSITLKGREGNFIY